MPPFGIIPVLLKQSANKCEGNLFQMYLSLVVYVLGKRKSERCKKLAQSAFYTSEFT